MPPLGTVIGADQPGEAHAAEIQHHRALGGKLAVILAVINAQKLAVQLVAAVHGARVVPFPLAHLLELRFGIQVGHAVGGDRAGEDEQHRLAAPLRLLGSQLQQAQRALHVHLMCGFGGELAAGGEQRRQVIDDVDLVFAHQPGEQDLYPGYRPGRG